MKMRHERHYIRDGSGPDESESETCSQDVSDGDLEATKAVCFIAFCEVEIKIDSGPDSTLQPGCIAAFGHGDKRLVDASSGR